MWRSPRGAPFSLISVTAAHQVPASSAGVGDGGRGADELRVDAVEGTDTPQAAQHVGHVLPNTPR
jgi:hypothetical protein